MKNFESKTYIYIALCIQFESREPVAHAHCSRYMQTRVISILCHLKVCLRLNISVMNKLIIFDYLDN